MKSLDSGILWKCKTNWTTGRQWTIYLRNDLQIAWTLKLLLQEGEVAWAAQREEHGATRADQSAQAQASSAWEWPAQENVYWIDNNSIFCTFPCPQDQIRPSWRTQNNGEEAAGTSGELWRTVQIRSFVVQLKTQSMYFLMLWGLWKCWSLSKGKVWGMVHMSSFVDLKMLKKPVLINKNQTQKPLLLLPKY